MLNYDKFIFFFHSFLYVFYTFGTYFQKNRHKIFIFFLVLPLHTVFVGKY